MMKKMLECTGRCISSQHHTKVEHHHLEMVCLDPLVMDFPAEYLLQYHGGDWKMKKMLGCTGRCILSQHHSKVEHIIWRGYVWTLL